MLTNEQADERVKGLSDAQLAQLADQVGSGDGDQRLLATRAVLEKVRRTQRAETAARVAAPQVAAERAARAAYDAAGLPAAGFDAWYQERLAKETGDKLDQQRAAMRYMAQRRF